MRPSTIYYIIQSNKTYLYHPYLKIHMSRSASELLGEIHQFYKEIQVQRAVDRRTEEQKQQQGKEIAKITHRNLAAFNLTLSKKERKSFKPPPLFRMDLPEGVYCYVSDNQVESQQTILAIHGLPGSSNEWASLQGELGGKYRWVSVSLPGADGEDERRGSFSGSAEDLTQLVFQVVSKLKLSRLTLCCHSFGSIVGRNFAHAFPALVEGFINLGGTMSYWSFGMTMVYKLMIYDNKYHEEAWRSQRLYEKDGEREKLHQKYTCDYKEKKYAEYGLPFYAKFEYFIFLKVHSYPPTLLDHSYGVYSALPLLKLTIYAKDDRLFLPERAEATLYDYLFSPHSFTQSPAFRSLLRTAKPAVEARLRQLGVGVEGERLPEYFCFLLEKTGHLMHRQRSEEIGVVIPVFLTALQVLHEHRQVLPAKL